MCVCVCVCVCVCMCVCVCACVCACVMENAHNIISMCVCVGGREESIPETLNHKTTCECMSC